MPVVVFCGYPSAGKSTWAKKLGEYLEAGKGKRVTIVREEDLFRGEKNDILDDSRKEKELRGKLKSETQRLLNKDDIVIIDALNYIKGYRYELYCMSKAVPTKQVTVQCEAPIELAWEWNSTRPSEHKYTRPVFDHLIQRFESPDPQNRWDSPFFSVLPGEELDLEGIYNSLYFSKPVKQNQSTQLKPLSGSSFLSSLERVTSDITNALVAEQKKVVAGADCEEFSVPHSTIPVLNQGARDMNIAQLTRFKRQFITMTKAGSVQGEIGDLFVQYLNSQFANS